MKKFLKKLGIGLSSLSTLIVCSATWGIYGEVEPPDCLK